MSRQSAADLALVRPVKPRAQAPVALTDEQTAIWREVVDSMPTGHFTAADDALLRTFVEVTEQLRQAQRRIGKRAVVKGRMSPWFAIFEKATRMQTALARALRIATNARVDRTKAGRLSRTGPSGAVKPWGG